MTEGAYRARDFSNARVVGTGMSYAPCPFKRGEREFTMSRSSLLSFAPNPQRWLDGWRKDATDSTDWGNLIDCLFLVPDMFDQRFVVRPDTYESKEEPSKREIKANPNAAAKIVKKDWHPASHTCQQWLRDNATGRQVTQKIQLDSALAAVDVLLRDKLITDAMEGAKTQVLVTCDYRDAATGIVVPLQCLIDVVPTLDYTDDTGASVLGDLKSARNAHPGGWKKEVHGYGLDMQAALYLDMWNAATGEGRTGFLHIISENLPPYAIGRRNMGTRFIDLGRTRYRNALRKYCLCLKSGVWPGYDEAWSTCEPDDWMIRASAEDFSIGLDDEAPEETDEAPDDGEIVP